MKIGITGQTGFVGRHLFNFLKLQKNVQLIDFERSYFEEESLLDKFVSNCNVIIHLAAMNRHKDPQVIYETNVKLVKVLIAACERKNVTPSILFSSSTQEDLDNQYGRSKKEGSKLLSEWSDRTCARVINMKIPNVFGPFGKPFYNSVVSTFCHLTSQGGEPKVLSDSNLNLIYINELLEDIYALIFSNKSGHINIVHRHKISVSRLAEKVRSYRDTYLHNGEFPAIDSPFDLALFNTFRCYIDHNHYPVAFTTHKDNRGAFVEIVRANTSGQFSFSTTNPGITRGEHFHTRKAERFVVIKGKARISLRKIDTDEIIDYVIDGKQPSYVDMPIWYTHNITNIGNEELICLFWINEPYDPSDPDTYFVKVRKES